MMEGTRHCVDVVTLGVTLGNPKHLWLKKGQWEFVELPQTYGSEYVSRGERQQFPLRALSIQQSLRSGFTISRCPLHSSLTDIRSTTPYLLPKGNLWLKYLSMLWNLAKFMFIIYRPIKCVVTPKICLLFWNRLCFSFLFLFQCDITTCFVSYTMR